MQSDFILMGKSVANLFSGYTEQERALSDGRIGPEIVKIDTSGRCGNMDISENLEVNNIIIKNGSRWLIYFIIRFP